MLCLRTALRGGSQIYRSSPCIYPSSLLQTRCLISKPYVPPKIETYDKKNERLSRPLSPHLSIYKMQLQMLLSGTHRSTGLVAYIYVFSLAAGSFSSYTYPEMIAYIGSLGLPAWFLFITKWGLAFPVSYHMTNGLRHLNWDMARSLTIKGVIGTGYTVLAVTFILNTVFALL